MKTRHPILVLIAVVAALSAACSGSKPTSTVTPTRTSPTSSPSTIVVQPGHFAYNFVGVKATFVMNGHSAVLTVHNGAGVQLGPPRIVVIDQKDQHVQGTIAGAKPIANGASATFTVTFPASIDQTTIGLIQMSFGDVMYGLLAPA